VIAITEVKSKVLKDLAVLNEFNLLGYDCYCTGLEDVHSRGILIYIDKGLDSSLVDMPMAFKENIFVEVRLSKNTKLLIGNMYRSPASDLTNDENLVKLLKYITSNYNIPIVIVGDFNYGGIKWTTDVVSFSGLSQSEINFAKSVSENCLLQHVNKPTRQRGKDTPHILDLVLTSDDCVSDIEYNSPLGMSDHSILAFNCHLGVETQSSSNKFKFERGDYEGLRKYLSRDWEVDLNGDSNTVDEMWHCFRDTVLEGMAKFIPKSGCQYNAKKNCFHIVNQCIH